LILLVFFLVWEYESGVLTGFATIGAFQALH